jgi:hypothetical protein
MLFILAVGFFFAALTVTYTTVFFNLVLIIISIFVLLQACGRVDKALGLGKYAKVKHVHTCETNANDTM